MEPLDVAANARGGRALPERDPAGRGGTQCGVGVAGLGIVDSRIEEMGVLARRGQVQLG